MDDDADPLGVALDPELKCQGRTIEDAMEHELSSGQVCRAACAATAVFDCAAVTAVCASGTFITVGAFSLPCWIAIPTACAAAAGGGSLCRDWCTEQYGP
jgi:3-polyprenyl-4-hydroxybenzoate decarboxylase